MSNQSENRRPNKRQKLNSSEEFTEENIKMESDDRKSNFSALSAQNGAVIKAKTGSSKGDIKKIVIKNFRCKFHLI